MKWLCRPWHIEAGSLNLCHRPRLYWVDWDLPESSDCEFGRTPQGRASIKLRCPTDPKPFLTPGWRKNSEGVFPTFTTSQPRQSPGYKPAGVHQCNEETLQRWREDQHRFPPYQYQPQHCLVNKAGTLRLPNVHEKR